MATKSPTNQSNAAHGPLAAYLPEDVRTLGACQKDLPRIAKDRRLLAAIEEAVREIPTRHDLFNGDARRMDSPRAQSLHLVLTSPPYWTLKEYRKTEGQLGSVRDYDEFLAQLDQV